MKKKLMMLCVAVMAAMGAWGATNTPPVSAEGSEPKVTDVVAKQRYPGNGLVDITCNVSGIVGTTNELKLALAAVMPDTGNARSVRNFGLCEVGVIPQTVQLPLTAVIVCFGMLGRILEQWTTAIWLFVFHSMLTIRYSYGRVAHIGQQRISVQKSHGSMAIFSGGVIRLGISERMTSGSQAMDRILTSHLFKVILLLITKVSQPCKVKVGLSTDSNSGACCRLCRRPASEMEMTFVR